MKGLTYKDRAILLRLEADEYGDFTRIADRANILTLFRHGMSSNMANYVDNIGTDAHVYLDINNPFVARNMERVEGMYLIFNRYGENIWYKIERAIVGRTMLTDNKDNCLHCFLSKSAALLDIGNESS